MSPAPSASGRNCRGSEHAEVRVLPAHSASTRRSRRPQVELRLVAERELPVFDRGAQFAP